MTDWFLGIDVAGGELVAATATAGDSRHARLGGLRGIPATVHLADDGRLFTDGDAASEAEVRPERSAPMVDRLIGTNEPIFPGLSPATAHEALARLLASVLAIVTADQGSPPAGICLAHPTRWRASRRRALAEAAEAAGMDRPELVAASVAAAHRLAADERPAAVVAVYFIGATTSEAAVVRRTAGGWSELRGARSLDLGALDLDRRLLDYVIRQALPGARAEPGASLMPLVTRSREELSGRPTAEVEVPGAGPLRLTRDEVEELLSPLLKPSIGQLVATVERAIPTADLLTGVVVTGAASAFPLVDRLISEALGRAPRASDERHADIALGAAELALEQAPLPHLTPLVPPRQVGPSDERAARSRPAGPPIADLDVPPPPVERMPRRDPPPAPGGRSFRSTIVRPPPPAREVLDRERVVSVGVPREPESRRLLRIAAIFVGAAAAVVLLYLLAYPGALGDLSGGPETQVPTSVAPVRVSPEIATLPPGPATALPSLEAPSMSPEERLTAMLPSAPTVTNCRSAQLEVGDITSMECDAQNVDRLWYALKVDRGALDAELAAVRLNMAEAGIVSDTNLCSPTWNYDRDSDDVVRGVLLCFTSSDGTAQVISTLDEALVISGMERDDGELDLLVASWRTLVPQVATRFVDLV